MEHEYCIGCVVVTFNRKNLLERCLSAIKQQTYKPKTVYIIDNASTDGTDKYIASAGYCNKDVNGIFFQYHRCERNEGGAGGFYTGMKLASESDSFDGIWVMDDDGEPERNCLKELVPFLKDRDYIAPIVLSDEDHDSCSFVPDTTYSEFCKKADGDGVVEGWASPFNGILYSASLVKKIGYPKKEMFIWGDEINYQIRAEKAGFHRMTTVKAIHYHPVNRQNIVRNADTFNAYLVVVDVDWKLYCAIRNRIYNIMLEQPSKWRGFRMSHYLYRAYRNYYRVTLGNDSKTGLIRDAFVSGLIGRFGGLKKFFNK